MGQVTQQPVLFADDYRLRRILVSTPLAGDKQGDRGLAFFEQLGRSGFVPRRWHLP